MENLSKNIQDSTWFVTHIFPTPQADENETKLNIATKVLKNLMNREQNEYIQVYLKSEKI